MRIISIHVFSLYKSKPIILSSAFSLSFVSIFQRGTLKDFLNFHSRLVIERVQKDTHAQVQLEKGICYAIANDDKIGVTMICDEEYPKRVAIDFLLRVHENFKSFMNQKKLDLNSIDQDTDVKFDYISTAIEEWQDPSKKDNIIVIHRIVRIEETNGVKKIYTKGDNNPQEDIGYITYDDLRGVAKLRIKKMGLPTIWINELF